MNMEMAGASGLSQPDHSETGRWSSNVTSKFQNVSLVSQEENFSSCYYPDSGRCYEFSSKAASQVLWATGTYSGSIPNGFYCVIPDKKLKELFRTIPSPEELCSTDIEMLREEVILVDAERDKRLSMLKQLSRALIKGKNANPASLIKKLAGLVWDFYRRPSLEPSSAQASVDEIFNLKKNKGFQLLGQLRHGSCRPRAILFKVLADTVGLESKLMVGLPRDGSVEYIDSYKHMSVVVVLNSLELLVDLMRYPGQLIPFSAKAIFISHISAPGDCDSGENDSCDSPHEPNSPLCEFPDGEGNHEQDVDSKSLYHQQRSEAVSNVAGSSLQNLSVQPPVYTEGMLSLSHSEPNVAKIFSRRNQRKEVVEQRTASSSPEHPFFRRSRSILGDCSHPLKEYADGLAETRSAGATTSEVCRSRRQSINMNPKIGDGIARAVRTMNEKLKKNNLMRDDDDEVSGLHFINGKNGCGNSPKNESSFSLGKNDKISVSQSNLRKRINSNLIQTETSLPSSPYECGGETSYRSGDSSFSGAGSVFSTMNTLLQSSHFLNEPLFPFEEWNIELSELTTGSRVGIGFFGEVFRGTWNGTDVAIKVFLEQDMTAENIEDFCNEISILSRLRHPNVILFLGACMRPPHLSMVTEYMEMGSLYYLIHISGQKKKLSWRRRFRILRDICRGLMCIHRMKIIHRDLKSANCLVDKHWTVKICDFGLSQIIRDGAVRDNSSAGTPEWMAPELIRNEPITYKCDIFSLGVIMWELCTLSRPWEGIPAVQVVYAVANEGTRLEIPEGPLGRLIADCWAEPDERPSCQEILSRLLDCEYTLG